MAILKIRDSDGTVKEILALKGDKVTRETRAKRATQEQPAQKEQTVLTMC